MIMEEIERIELYINGHYEAVSMRQALADLAVIKSHFTTLEAENTRLTRELAVMDMALDDLAERGQRILCPLRNSDDYTCNRCEHMHLLNSCRDARKAYALAQAREEIKKEKG